MSNSTSLNNRLSLYYNLIFQSFNLQFLTNFFTLVKQDLLEKLDAIAKTAEAASESELESNMAKLLEETEYDFVNIYSCSFTLITAASDISNVSYGCWYEAAVMYAIYLGETSTANVTETLKDMKSYDKEYSVYTNAMQDSLFSDWGKWYEGSQGRANYSCGSYKGNDWEIEAIDSCETRNPRKVTPALAVGQGGGAGSGFLNTPVSPTQFEQPEHQIAIANAFIKPETLEDTCASMASFWDISINPSDLDYITYNTLIEGEQQIGTLTNYYTITNTTAVTDIDNLIDFLKEHLFHAPASDLFEIAASIHVFGSASDSMTTIKIEGNKQIAIEKKGEK